MVRVARRDASVDAVRILAIVAVVTGHVWFEPAVNLSTYTWHVPVFFVLSGYVASTRAAGLAALAGFLRRRTRALLVPYAAWLGILAVVLGALDDPLRLLAGGTYTPRGFTAFWFVTAFFVAVVAADAIERMPLAGQWAVAFALLTAGYLTSSVIAMVPLDAGVGLACLVFIVAGRTLRVIRHRIERPVVTGTVMLAAAVALIVSGASAPLDLKKGDFGTPVVSVLTAILVSWALILVARPALARLPERAGRVVSVVALGGFVVVLTHGAVLALMRGLEVEAWVVFALALVVPWALATVLLYAPLAPVLTGVPRQRMPGRGARSDVREPGDGGEPSSVRRGDPAVLEHDSGDIREPALHHGNGLGVLVDEHEATAERRRDRAGRA